MMFLLAVVVLGGYAIYVITPEERRRLLDRGEAVVRRTTGGVTRHLQEPFSDALRTRTRWPIVTLALVALNLGLFAAMHAGAGGIADPAMLVAWGGNVGPRTTNGEWWRLVTSIFVHASFWHLLANMAGLVQLGMMLERLVGHAAFAMVYVAAGVFGSLVSVFASPLGVSVGASGAIFGLYGLLIASMIWGRIRRSAMTIPLQALKPMGPAAAVFVLYRVVSSPRDGAELAGLVAGFACSVILAKGVSERKPGGLRIAATVAVTLAIAIITAAPLRAMTDARPEIARVVAFEERTTGAYQLKVDQFKLGAIGAKALALLIDGTIRPELEALRSRVQGLERVPAVQQPLLASAGEYLRLRSESWRLRSEGLRQSSQRTLRKADEAEHASMRAYQEIVRGTPTPAPPASGQVDAAPGAPPTVSPH
jgi:rhomboid protease GluP